MKIEDDYAIIETAEEAGCIVASDPNEKLSEWDAVLGCDPSSSETQISSTQVLEAITPKEGDCCVWFDHPCWSTNGPPKLLLKWTGKRCNGENMSVRYYIKANALTIGKTIGELRALLEWCKS